MVTHSCPNQACKGRSSIMICHPSIITAYDSGMFACRTHRSGYVGSCFVTFP